MNSVSQILLLLIGITFFWMSIVFLISRTSGWAALARHYAAANPPDGEPLGLCSGRLRFGASYRNCLKPSVSRSGLYLRPIVIYKTGHPPLFIPWNAIADLERSDTWLGTSARMAIRMPEGASMSFTLLGTHAVDRLEHYWRAHRGSQPEPENAS